MNTKLTQIISDFISLVAIRLPDDVESSLHSMAEGEDGLSKQMYNCIFDNIELAKKLNRPLCQDTGVLQFFVKVGTKFPYIDEIRSSIIEATKAATANTPLRPNVVEPFTEHNTANNVGSGAPCISWELSEGKDTLHIDMYMAGGGCSLPGRSKVLMPLEGINGVKKFVYDTVVEWGVNACPPLVVGIGLGTCAVTSAELSKKALLRPIGTHSENSEARSLEIELKEGLDSIGIAPLGLGGKKSVQAVNIECAGHHPATLGVGVSIGCWATRRGSMDINADLTAKITSHTLQ